jgi:hypothetical protein
MQSRTFAGIHLISKVAVLLAITFFVFSSIKAQTTDFVYQGKLNNGSVAANGLYDFKFDLYDNLTAGTLIKSVTINGVQVTNGLFSVNLDFVGTIGGTTLFADGLPKYLEIWATNTATFTTPLSPRQQVKSTPYAIRSLSAGNANNLGGTPASSYVVTTDARLSDDRSPAPGSGNYIQNGSDLQAGNFYVNGDGRANAFNANTEYQLGGLRILGVVGFNFFVGHGAGNSNPTGLYNTFAGNSTGYYTTSGSYNSFFGTGSGFRNTSGSNNTFAGAFSGQNNTTGAYNTFSGAESGKTNSTGDLNSFFGSAAGLDNSTGFYNSFFGASSGWNNATGSRNTFIGTGSGNENTTGSNNTFIGVTSGTFNTYGSRNTYIGEGAGLNNVFGDNNTALGSDAKFDGDRTFATAIGAGAIANLNNTIQLGRNTLDSVRIGRLAPVDGNLPLCWNANRMIASCASGIISGQNSQEFITKIEAQQKQIDEQKALIGNQQKEIERQKNDLTALKQLICAGNEKAEICKSKEQ